MMRPQEWCTGSTLVMCFVFSIRAQHHDGTHVRSVALLNRAQTSGLAPVGVYISRAQRPQQPAGSLTLTTTATNSNKFTGISRKTFCTMAGGDDRYHPQDAVGAAINGTLITGTAGAFMSAVQNALARQNIGAMSVFTRTGGVIAVFGTATCFLS